MNMNYVDVDRNEILAAEASLPAGHPVVMLNLLAFRSEAQYQNPSEKPCSGMEAYIQRYAPAFTQVAEELGIQGIEVVYVGAVAHTILGPKDPKWDALALVRYPDFAALRTVIESAAYLAKAEPHRKAALKAWEFIATTPQSVGK